MAKLLIVGGGLSGSLLAVRLARRGHSVKVLERRAMSPSPSERRAALNITLCERGLNALERVGMREEVLKLAVPARGRRLHAPDGSTSFQPYGNRGEAIYSISRTELNQALLKLALEEPNVDFLFEHRFAQFDLSSGVAHAEHLPTSRPTAIAADAVFGADGAFSAVRAQMQRAPHFNLTQEYWRHGGYKSLWLPAPADGSHALPGEALHIWPRGNCMLMGFPNRDGSAILSLLLPYRGENSYEQLQTPAQVLEFFRASFSDVAERIPNLGEQFFEKPPTPLLTIRCDPWSQHGKFVLLGDAAHAILPSYGQGANAAFEDCAIIDDCITRHGENWPVVFEAFEATRRPSMDIMARLCVEHFTELTDLVSDPAFLRRRAVERRLNELYPELYQPLYSMISFTSVSYAEAARIDARQHAAIDRIMALPSVDERIETEEVRLLLTAVGDGTPAEPLGLAPLQDASSVLVFALGFWGARALLAAVELHVFEALSTEALSAAELAERVGLHPRGARDFFDALTALGFLGRTDERYTNLPITRDTLLPAGGSYVGGALELAGARLYPVWAKLTAALRTGQPQNEAQKEADYYANLTSDPMRLKTFLRAMSGLSLMAARAIATKFPWERYESFADIGGAEGILALQVASKHEHVQGTNFDLPPVRAAFEDNVLAAGLTGRLGFHGGDFFRDPLPAAQVLVMGHVLHNWSLDQKKLLIQKAYAALPQGGALIVYEAMIDNERRQNAFGLLMSLNMLLVTPEGFVFTPHDCQRWMLEAGFKSTDVQHLHGPDWMVVGIK
jgi:2-polyprenyl-6-methoxyphenol hydroxylase-like FAD-dependent oxidoreductase